MITKENVDEEFIMIKCDCNSFNKQYYYEEYEINIDKDQLVIEFIMKIFNTKNEILIEVIGRSKFNIKIKNYVLIKSDLLQLIRQNIFSTLVNFEKTCNLDIKLNMVPADEDILKHPAFEELV